MNDLDFSNNSHKCDCVTLSPKASLSLNHNFESVMKSRCDIFSKSDISNMLTGGTFSDHFRLINSKPDGHCILHSITSCLHHYNTSVDKCDIFAFLLHSLRTECLRNVHLYTQLFESIFVFDNERDRYLNSKEFNLSFVDLVPQMFSNVLGCGIIVIDVHSAKSQDLYELSPTIEHRVTSIQDAKVLYFPNTLLLYRENNHYDGCTPLCVNHHSDYSVLTNSIVSPSDADVLIYNSTAGDLSPYSASIVSRPLSQNIDNSQHEVRSEQRPLASILNNQNLTYSSVRDIPYCTANKAHTEPL